MNEPPLRDPPPEEGQASMSRRALLAGAGLLAAAAGAGLAHWRSAASGAVQEPTPGFWALQWNTPQGGLVRLADFRGKSVLLNFWATWCPPCVQELPMLNQAYSQNHLRGFSLIGLAVDKPESVQAFLGKLPLEFPIALAAQDGAALARSLGNMVGALPFSVLLDSAGRVAQRKMGRLNPEDLAAWTRLE